MQATSTRFRLSKPPRAVEWAPPASVPGKPISELKGKHSGSVAILFNGASLPADLSFVRMPVIGMNRTHRGWPDYKGPQPDYLCVVDQIWLRRDGWKESVRSHPGLINGSEHEGAFGYRTRRDWSALFSFDLEKGYACHRPCTVGHLALQAAVYLGFRDLYCFGFDLAGPHFDGTRASKTLHKAVEAHAAQKPLLERAGVKVFVVGSPDSKAPFEHISYEAALAA